MKQQRILVVENERSFAQTLRRALSRPGGGGYAVDYCESGEAALARCQESSFDLIITGLRMPGMSGLELLEQVRASSPRTRTILMTAFATPQVEERARRLADVYLPRPFELQALIETVQRMLSVSPAVSHSLIAFSQDGLSAIQKRMEDLRRDVAALGVMLLDQSGQLLAETGQRGDFDTDTFLALLGNAMAAANEVAHMLKDDRAFDLHFHEGGRYEIYTVRITDQVSLCLALSRHETSSRIGMVWLYLRRAITDLRELLNQATIAGSAQLETDQRSAVGEALEQAALLADDLGKTPSPADEGEAAEKTASSVKAGETPDAATEPREAQPPPASSPETGEELFSLEEARARGLIGQDFLKH
jgi:two-component system response regulator (stage 0 sporulation protein F)